MPTAQASTTATATSASIWAAIPGLLWFLLVVVLLIMFRKELRRILSEFAWRLHSGAALKIASIELGPIVLVPGGNVSEAEKGIGVRPDKDHARSEERAAYQKSSREIMLVHRLYRSREDGQLYDLIIYVIPHKDASLAGVSKVEYFLGRYWGNKIFPSSDRSRGFAIATAAYGPMLCTAKLFFNDGESAILHRYIDFEMGSWAPVRVVD